MIKGLPEKLKELRKQNALSQRTVAKRLNISPSIVSGYETGERTPSTEILLALSYLYHCTTDFLLGREQISKEMTVSLEGLSPKQVQLITELVETMR